VLARGDGPPEPPDNPEAIVAVNAAEPAPAGQRTAAGLIDGAVTSGVIPGAVLAAGLGSAEPLIRHVAGFAQDDSHARRAMTYETIFDLASLTKVAATLPCVLRLVAAGQLGLDHPVRRYLPGFAGAGKDAVTVRQLLTHTSGLPGHREYYKYPGDPAKLRAAALAEPLVTAPGTRVCYSDIGFITLGELCAAVAGGGLRGLVAELVCRPLGMADTGYLPAAGLAGRMSSTEATPGLGGPSSGAGTAGIAKTGVVHDENAEAMGGVAGHAGLFGTAADLSRYAAAWAAAGTALADSLGVPGWLRADALRCQTEGMPGAPRPEDGTRPAADRRGLGWGLRGDRWDNMGDGWPLSGAGHTGFTGTSLSIDPASGLWAVLLTNAVHYGRGPEHSVVGLRKQVHAAVAAALTGGAGQAGAARHPGGTVIQ
jgi:serine-type D-Ala-D-Ala carboxypeptidase